jgi:hypothetical protein
MGYSKTLAGLSSGLDVKSPNRVLNWTVRSPQSADIPFKFRHVNSGRVEGRLGSCVTSIASPNGGAQLYER